MLALEGPFGAHTPSRRWRRASAEQTDATGAKASRARRSRSRPAGSTRPSSCWRTSRRDERIRARFRLGKRSDRGVCAHGRRQDAEQLLPPSRAPPSAEAREAIGRRRRPPGAPARRRRRRCRDAHAPGAPRRRHVAARLARCELLYGERLRRGGQRVAAAPSSSQRPGRFEQSAPSGSPTAPARAAGDGERVRRRRQTRATS